MNEVVRGRRAQPRLSDVLRELPLCDEVFLGMQALNLDIVDGYLEELEADLLREYIEIERTPPAVLFVSALSQMWIFGLYEFFRTWKQRAREILRWADELSAASITEREAAVAAKRLDIETRSAEAEGADVRWQAFEKAAQADFAEQLRAAVDKSERMFHTVEAVRMNLAKHEVPGQYGVFAMAPGYGRIDMETGSMSWQVEVGNNEVFIASRREIADMCRDLAKPNDRILPRPVQEAISHLPSESYGVKRVAVTLEDGTEYPGVRVAWNKEVVGVMDYDRLPFQVAAIAGVRHDPYPQHEVGDQVF
jgi:hypothetical protein